MDIQVRRVKGYTYFSYILSHKTHFYYTKALKTFFILDLIPKIWLSSAKDVLEGE